MSLLDVKCVATLLGIKVFFPYHKELIAAIRSIPSAKYLAKDKSWLVPLTIEGLTRFEGICNQYQITIDEKIQTILNNKNTLSNDSNQITLVPPNKLCFVYAYDDTITLLIKSLGGIFERNLKVWILTATASNVQDIRKVISLGKFSVPTAVLGLLENLERFGQ